MKKLMKKTKGVAQGAPSGLVISLLVHAAAFMLAGLLVVFSVVKKKEVSFAPPPAVERPKMKLKKPKVKVKKTAKPASPTRIVAKINKADMPDLQLPELGGSGSGFGGIGDLGGFDTMILGPGSVDTFVYKATGKFSGEIIRDGDSLLEERAADRAEDRS